MKKHNIITAIVIIVFMALSFGLGILTGIYGF